MYHEVYNRKFGTGSRVKKDPTSMTVPKKKTISVIVDKLLHREFLSIAA